MNPEDLTNMVSGEKSTKIGEGTFANVYRGDVVALFLISRRWTS